MAFLFFLFCALVFIYYDETVYVFCFAQVYISILRTYTFSGWRAFGLKFIVNFNKVLVTELNNKYFVKYFDNRCFVSLNR